LLNTRTTHQAGEFALRAKLGEALLASQIRSFLKVANYQEGIYAAIKDPQLSRVLAAMHQYPERVWTLENMAACALLSRTAFANRFHNTMKVTPFAYLNALRMSNAVSLLNNTDLHISVIASRVGYRSEQVFRRHFRKHYQVSPRQFRRSRLIRGENDKRRFDFKN